jgi:gluconolactonase
MTREDFDRPGNPAISRRVLIGRIGAAVGAAALAPKTAAGQGAPAVPPPVPYDPRRNYDPAGEPVSYPDPDIVTIDPAFNGLRVNNTAIHRLWTGGMWSEGPAWCSQGKYLVWSDVPMGVQRRWIDDDGRVTVFRNPTNNSNGNTFDFQGRQVSCEHTGRRIARYEHDGSITSIADAYNGQRLNSPNDVAAHRDGSYWFTDPAAGFTLYEGAPELAGAPGNADGRYNSRAGQVIGVGAGRREIMTANVYRADGTTGKVDMMMSSMNLPGNPNGIAFGPDYRKLYVVTNGIVHSFDLSAENKLSNQKEFSNFMVDGIQCRVDGLRVDVNGNVWCGSNAGRNLGYSGVTVWAPEGKILGRIRLPETCANLAFGGPKRNRLFMTAGQSLYSVYVNTQGASPG